jgi:uncharacterized membrane protein YphA (DoxX/SURF4 family)
MLGSMTVPRPLAIAARLLVRLVPGALFLWAGLEKAFDRQESILAVNAYDVLPEGLVRVVAAVLPWVEIAVGLLLILGLFVRFAGIATAVLAGVFIAGLAQAKARGLAIDCGCFGGGGAGDGVSWWDILRDVPILLCGVYLAARPRGPLQLDNVFLDVEVDDGQGDADEEADEERAPAGRG